MRTSGPSGAWGCGVGRGRTSRSGGRRRRPLLGNTRSWLQASDPWSSRLQRCQRTQLQLLLLPLQLSSSLLRPQLLLQPRLPPRTPLLLLLLKLLLLPLPLLLLQQLLQLLLRPRAGLLPAAYPLYRQSRLDAPAGKHVEAERLSLGGDLLEGAEVSGRDLVGLLGAPQQRDCSGWWGGGGVGWWGGGVVGWRGEGVGWSGCG